MALADVYDALLSVRPYKQPLSSAEARQIIYKGKGTQFDPLLVDVFIKVMEPGA
jgi:HD-GYP domain-containing protein (c-di-GMP phosphodiesterase class II)